MVHNHSLPEEQKRAETSRPPVEDLLRSHRDHLEALVRHLTNELEVKNAKLAGEIAERKHAEEALQESEARLKETQELGRIGCWGYEVETQRITWSNQTYRLYERDPALGPPTAEEEANYYAKEQLQKIREYAFIAVAEGKKFKYDLEAKLPSGKRVLFFATMQPVKDTSGRVVKLFGTVQDITESKLAEEQLRQMNQFLDTIIENIPLIITVKDAPTLTYQLVNRTFEQQIKTKNANIVGKTAHDLFSPSEAENINSNDRLVIQGKRPHEFEGRLTRTGRIYRTKKLPILDAEGEVKYLLSIADDVTEQKQIEQEREALLEKTVQISDLKSSLITQAAHDLKTPLTSILGWGELLYNEQKQRKNMDKTSDFEGIETIMRNAERLNNIINDFLDVNRIDSGKLEITKQSIDFRELIENATRAVYFLAAQKNITISSEMAPADPVSVDRRRMEQVIINLLSNAIKYSPECTRVTIKTGPADVGGHKMFQVQVIDNGYGFTPAELADAMNPFGKAYTQQEQKRAVHGTGLGLFISRRIVEQHGGTLGIQSEGVNKGTQVELLLPLG